ncbi:DUF5694 domain-containing protein [Lewinella sp. W8]|uniref:DUF5694 domain-containing protein n=1 Tax=Lewinella sp. W8 TaxID=2528208 RepID=UPI001067AC9E|nr:DUF5694 domain-containing protein [Lewinella sp. W8]MTB51330.1 hypothetical protein [Lewinella sp. W8]
MKTYPLLLLMAILLSASLHGQEKTQKMFNPDDILVQGDQQPQILLVGTFHFDYPGLDSHKTAAEDQVDVKSEKRRAEVEELLDYIARFKPNKIVVERRKGSKINENYRRYLEEGFELPRSEIYQLGFRLGKRFDVDTLVLGDAFTFSNSLYWHRDSLMLRPILDSIFADVEGNTDTVIDRRYYQLYDHEDEMLKNSTLLEHFKYENDVFRIRRGHGHYLEFESDLGPDALAIWWYSRNLRIYRNIQKATTSPDDRILVLFGAGHLGILRQQFESSPKYKLIDFADLENWSN